MASALPIPTAASAPLRRDLAVRLGAHESEQQPLRPGSAKASLAEAVKKPK